MTNDDSYLAKLVWALQHPEPETAMRAAILLGRMGREARPAMPQLQATLTSSDDVYLRAQILRACAAIDAKVAVPLLRQAQRDPSVIVRQAAEEELRRLTDPG
ncbi:MAG: HEAT repeat domain-containing protein [Firmicutes bacterium]|nr:HEAT repeat domain-containing protein [Bacillota bacterium]